jgi:hypothetical protein
MDLLRKVAAIVFAASVIIGNTRQTTYETTPKVVRGLHKLFVPHSLFHIHTELHNETAFQNACVLQPPTSGSCQYTPT